MDSAIPSRCQTSSNASGMNRSWSGSWRHRATSAGTYTFGSAPAVIVPFVVPVPVYVPITADVSKESAT